MGSNLVSQIGCSRLMRYFIAYSFKLATEFVLFLTLSFLLSSKKKGKQNAIFFAKSGDFCGFLIFFFAKVS